MEQKTKVDESLLDQLLNDFIYERLVPQYRLQFTEFLFDYNQFDFYLKFKDKLIPHPYLKGSSYCFNSELCLRLSRGNLDNYFLKGREAFFAYLLTELSLSESYLKYLNRLPGVPMPLFEKLKEDHLTARKSGDKTSTALLGTLLNDIKESILKGLSMAQYGILNPTDEQVLAIIKQYVSKNIETTDIAGPSPKMEAELAILQSYQPTLLTDSELVGIYVDFKTNFEGNEKALYGAFMKHLTQNYAYRYEGGKVRSIVSGV